MPRVAPIVPAETDILCEGCGYTLNGLPESGNCPECGKPIPQSLGEHRGISAFEAAPGLRSFLRTSLTVLLHPARFYRSLATREISAAAVWFGRCHRGVAAVLLSVAASGHVVAQQLFSPRWTGLDEPDLFSVLLAPLAAVIYVLMVLVTRLAAGLTRWEAAYRGIRLPLPVVLRGLNFHYVHYIPVAMLAAATVCGYLLLLDRGFLDPWTSASGYLYTLSAEVIICSAYLFITYWTAMKNMMYANR